MKGKCNDKSSTINNQVYDAHVKYDKTHQGKLIGISIGAVAGTSLGMMAASEFPYAFANNKANAWDAWDIAKLSKGFKEYSEGMRKAGSTIMENFDDYVKTVVKNDKSSAKKVAAGLGAMGIAAAFIIGSIIDVSINQHRRKAAIKAMQIEKSQNAE